MGQYDTQLVHQKSMINARGFFLFFLRYAIVFFLLTKNKNQKKVQSSNIFSPSKKYKKKAVQRDTDMH